MAESTVIVGVFNDRAQAEQAMRELKQARFRDVGFVVRREDVNTEALPVVKIESREERVPITGAVTGGIIGCILAGGIWMFLPSLLSLVVGGLWTIFLSGILGGLVIGGVLGSVVSVGTTEEESSAHEKAPPMERIIVIVQAEDRAMEAFHILEKYRIPNIEELQRGYSTVPQGNDPEATVEMKALNNDH